MMKMTTMREEMGRELGEFGVMGKKKSIVKGKVMKNTIANEEEDRNVESITIAVMLSRVMMIEKGGEREEGDIIGTSDDTALEVDRIAGMHHRMNMVIDIEEGIEDAVIAIILDTETVVVEREGEGEVEGEIIDPMMMMTMNTVEAAAMIRMMMAAVMVSDDEECESGSAAENIKIMMMPMKTAVEETGEESKPLLVMRFPSLCAGRIF